MNWMLAMNKTTTIDYKKALDALDLFPLEPITNVDQVADWAYATFPVLRDYKPLAVGVDYAFGKLAAKRDIPEELANCFLCRHTGSEKYLTNISTAGAHRNHLDGKDAGPVAEVDQHYAIRKLKGKDYRTEYGSLLLRWERDDAGNRYAVCKNDCPCAMRQREEMTGR